jgi:hypothetical protein
MQIRSALIGGSAIFFLIIAFSSCLPRETIRHQQSKQTKEQVEQVQPEPNLTTLECTYSGSFSGITNASFSNEKAKFQFNRKDNEVLMIESDGLRKMNAFVSPDLILFKSFQVDDNSFTKTENYQIDRKTLVFTNWGESKDAEGDVFSTWKGQGLCTKVVANTEGNKI